MESKLMRGFSMDNRCLESTTASCLTHRLQNLWPFWLLRGRDRAHITQYLFLDQNYHEVAKRCKHAESENFFFNLHGMYSPYYFPSVVFCSCCSAPRCSVVGGKGSRMAVWTASICSAARTSFAFPLAAFVLLPCCWASMGDPVIPWVVSFCIWSIQLRFLLLLTCGSAPCARVLLGCLLQAGLLPRLKVSALGQAARALRDRSLKSLLCGGAAVEAPQCWAARGSRWWFCTKISTGVHVYQIYSRLCSLGIWRWQ